LKTSGTGGRSLTYGAGARRPWRDNGKQGFGVITESPKNYDRGVNEENMDLVALDKLIQSNDIEAAINNIEEIGEDRSEEAVSFLIENLRTTENHLLRNAIALALRDIGSQEAVEPIIEVLNHPKTLGYRGTLLYALEPLDYSAHLDLLVDFLLNGNFEVSRKSLLLIESIGTQLPDETLLKCIDKVRHEIRETEEKYEFLTEALEIISDLKKNN
jgi:HEAT repeat protein